jgi:hypothetical protein
MAMEVICGVFNAQIFWDALSALGTAFAAWTAVWVYRKSKADERDKSAKARADSRRSQAMMVRALLDALEGIFQRMQKRDPEKDPAYLPLEGLLVGDPDRILSAITNAEVFTSSELRAITTAVHRLVAHNTFMRSLSTYSETRRLVELKQLDIEFLALIHRDITICMSVMQKIEEESESA